MKDIVKRLPEYDYLYLGDNARAPYGDRDFNTVYQYTLQAVEWLFGKGCHLLILACNTASAKALRTIQQNDLERIAPGKRVLGVIRPTAEVIGAYSSTGHIGVLGTLGTVQSRSYLIEIGKFFPAVKLSQEACPIWVPLVENNEQDAPGADYFIQKHIDHILKEDSSIDTLLLACTHYPLLMNKIKAYLPAHVKPISQGEIVSESLENYLSRHPEIDSLCTRQGERHFFTTGDPVDFVQRGAVFYGQTIEAQHVELK